MAISPRLSCLGKRVATRHRQLESAPRSQRRKRDQMLVYMILEDKSDSMDPIATISQLWRQLWYDDPSIGVNDDPA